MPLKNPMNNTKRKADVKIKLSGNSTSKHQMQKPKHPSSTSNAVPQNHHNDFEQYHSVSPAKLSKQNQKLDELHQIIKSKQYNKQRQMLHNSIGQSAQQQQRRNSGLKR